MTNRGVPSPSQLRHYQRADRTKAVSFERDQIRKFVRELYDELLRLALAAPPILQWPLRENPQQPVPAKPVSRKIPTRRKSVGAGDARGAGRDETPTFSGDVLPIIPDLLEPGLAPKPRRIKLRLV